MGHACDVIEDRIRRHLDDTLTTGPSQVLDRLVVKDVCDKDAFLAVADGTGHSAVIAVNTIGKISG